MTLSKLKQAEAVEREDGLDQQRAREEGVDEGAGKAGDDQQHGVAEHVAVEHLALVEALGLRGHHVLLADLVEERVARQERHGGEGAERHGDQRQHEVPEVVGDLAEQRSWCQLSEVSPREGNHWKNEPPANITSRNTATRKPGMA